MYRIAAAVYGGRTVSAVSATKSADRRRTKITNAQTRADAWHERKLAGDLAFAQGGRPMR